MLKQAKMEILEKLEGVRRALFYGGDNTAERVADDTLPLLKKITMLVAKELPTDICDTENKEVLVNLDNLQKFKTLIEEVSSDCANIDYGIYADLHAFLFILYRHLCVNNRITLCGNK